VVYLSPGWRRDSFRFLQFTESVHRLFHLHTFREDLRVVYAIPLADEIWVVHAFQKKSTQGIKTPKREIDLIRDRLKRLKEMLG
jgi:phage-related protein